MRAVKTPMAARSLRRFVLVTASCAVALTSPPKAQSTAASGPSTGAVRVYVGTYTSGESKGIYRLRLDLASGALAAEGEPTASISPSWVILDGEARFLYAVNETGDGPSDPTGGVSAFAVDPRSGALTFLNRQESGGPAPCHLSFDRSGRHLLVANYWGGSVAVFPIQRDGRLGAASAVVKHSGGTHEPGRDPGPHAHAVQLTADNRFAIVADLGRDEVMIYRFDAERGTLAPNDPAGIALEKGAGPRHLAFHPDGRHIFVINELASTVGVLSYDPDKGTLSAIQTVSTLPAGFQGKNSTAEVVVSSDGRFLYGSNRGHDSIAVFAIDPATRKLTAIGHQSTLGKTPRNFALDPTGRYLLAANQESDSVVVFRVDAGSGKLSPVGSPFRVPRPVCLTMVRLSR
jgi:6-phosphogluconolactonase